MVGVGEMLATAVVKAAVSQLLSLIQASMEGPVNRIRSFKADLQEMVEVLQSVEAGISDAEKRSVNDDVTRLWLKRLKKAAYEISDMFDEFQHGNPPGKLQAPTMWYKVFLSGDMAKKMKNMKKKLERISEGREKYGNMGQIRESDHGRKSDKLETTSRLGSDMIVGRMLEKETVINILLSSNNNKACTTNMSSGTQENSSYTVIHGLAGVGKTELAKLVFNDERIWDAFPRRAWVYLHQSSGINDIGNAIIGEIEGGVCRFDNKQAINKHLEKVLKDRCLIVLDNLWDSGQLTGLRDILGTDVSILVTSRRAIPLHTVKTISFHLETLSEKWSFELVKQVASSYCIGNDGIPETAMNEIVTKCRGVPLALKAVTSSLLKHGRGGEELLPIIKARLQPKSEYGTMGIDETVFESLKLTYHLMTPCLKLCFAYCAIFPKGSQIDWKDLYHQWTALGLIQGLEEIDKKLFAEEKVRQLLDMSFLRDAELSSVTRRSTGVPAKLKMHDLVHDLAMSVADDDLVVISPDNSECASDRPRYALIDACENMNLFKDLPGCLRALHIMDSPLLKFKWYNYSFVKFLRVLDIRGTYIEKFPSSIRNFMQMRYLNASGIQSKELPKAIGSLPELQYLKFHGSSISALPESASKLGRLLHLDLSACMNLQMLPKSFCDLKCLSLLNLENCSLLSSLPEDLGRLNNLDNLNLSGCTCLDILPESLGELELLTQLELSGCKNLSMLPDSFGQLTNLKYLNISRCSNLDIPVDALNKLIKLEYLNMSSCPKLFGLPQEFCSLKNLGILNLSDCSNLKTLPERLGQMKSLRFVSLDGCAESVRKSVLQHGLGAGLQSLPAFVIETEIDSIRSNISGLENEKFSELELYRLEKVKIVDEADALKLSTRSELRSLGLMWTLNIKRFINDEALLHALEPPEHLQKLRVQGYMGKQFPKWNMEIGSCHRVHLNEVRLMHFPMFNSLPYLGGLANLKNLHLSRMPKIRSLGSELCGHTGSLKKLEIFTLEYMENLVEWCTTFTSASGQANHVGFMFPALQDLNIYHCPQLTMQPCPPRSIKWDVRASSKPAQLLLKKDEVMQSLADYMGLLCPFGCTTELHVSDYSTSSRTTADGWKFHGSLIALDGLTCDTCRWIDILLGKGNNMQCLVNLEISGVEDAKGIKLKEQVDTIAYSTRSSLSKSWPDWFSQPIRIKNGVSPHFLLAGYATCLLRGWIDEITSVLGNLIRINMDELPLCDRLPPLGHLPNLQELRLKGIPKIRRIDSDFCGSNHSSSATFFPRLTSFILNDLRNLEEWITKVPITRDPFGHKEFMFPGLLNLTIWNCPKLKLNPCPPRAREWDINNSDNVISSSYDINTANEPATTLQVLLTKMPPNEWNLLDHLPRIENLAIVSCHGIESLPNSIRGLSCLQSLTVSKCHGLKHLPEWLGELTSLEKLMVVSCPMEFLPGSLVRLSFLRSLSLSCCDRLVALPGCFRDLNSLEMLTIEGCNSLKSLPQFSMLEHLLLKYNGELEKWCETEVNKTKFANIKRQIFWLESTRGSNSYLLPARSLAILWGHDDRYWRITSTPISRFAVSMQLLEVWWLVIEGSIPMETLTTNTSYEVYLVYKLAEEHDGLRWGESYVHVDGLHTDGANVSFVDEDAVRVDGVAYPVSRSEGWMELRLGTFCYKLGDNEVKVGVTERTNTYAKKGLIIEGMEIRQSA